MAMTPTWRIVVAPAANAAAVAGSTGSSGAPSSANLRPDLLRDPHVLTSDVVVPGEQVLQAAGGGLVALRDQGAVAVDDGDLGNLGSVHQPRSTLGHQQCGEGISAGIDERGGLPEQARGLGERVLGHASILLEHTCE